MAQFPGVKRQETPAAAPAAPAAPTVPAAPTAPAAAPETPAVPTAVTFEDGAMPSALAKATAANPFQEKVNEIDKNVRAGVQPSASSYLAKNADVEWARARIRAAITNIKRGADTTVIPEKGMPGYSRVWFTTKEATKRTRTK
jgi:hypothetical protein